MKEILLSAAFSLIPGVIYYFSSHSNSSIYVAYSQEALKDCFSYAREANIPLSVCSDINAASRAAFFSAVSSVIPFIAGITTSMFFIFWWLLTTRKEIRELKAKFDV